MPSNIGRSPAATPCVTSAKFAMPTGKRGVGFSGFDLGGSGDSGGVMRADSRDPSDGIGTGPPRLTPGGEAAPHAG